MHTFAPATRSRHASGVVCAFVIHHVEIERIPNTEAGSISGVSGGAAAWRLVALSWWKPSHSGPFQVHYERTASPFKWTFTRSDLQALLAKLNAKRLAPAA